MNLPTTKPNDIDYARLMREWELLDDRNKELERENAALREKFMFAESEIILLREEREELREDKERLDWLESGCSCDLSWVGKEAPPSALTSLRNAIDWTRKEART